MITKLIQFKVSSEDAPAFQSALQRVEEASKPEDGCIQYAAFVSKSDPCEFTILEVWDSEESLEAHRQTAHLTEFKSECGDMIKEKTGLELDPL